MLTPEKGCGLHIDDYREIRARVTWNTLLTHYDTAGQFTKREFDTIGPCPLCNGTTAPSFKIGADGWGCCSSCNFLGNMFHFVARKESCTFEEAALNLKRWFPSAPLALAA